MKIVGNIRPYADKPSHYTMVDDTGRELKVETWQIFCDKRLLAENNKGIFTFGPITAGKTLTLIGKIRNLKTRSLVSYSISIKLLMGVPKILDVYWKDINGEKITGRAVGYLDKVTLVVKTINIPAGDKLKITIYEDEYLDGHSDRTSRKMGEYLTKGITKNGYAFIEFNNIKVYQKILNKIDYINEPNHEFYVKIEYGNGKIHLIKDGIILKIKNKLNQMVTPYTGVKPVVVGVKNNQILKSQKSEEQLIFNIFFDGTGNNMNNSTKRIKKQSLLTDDSYKNYYSNIALLYMTIKKNYVDNIINIYIEGVGTRNDLTDELTSSAFAEQNIFSYIESGIKHKIYKVFQEIKEKYNSYEKIPNIFIFNVFGFSRGAATARYFMSLEKALSSILKLDYTQKIKFNFVGIYDTVASYGYVHYNDVEDLKLYSVCKAKKVIHLTAGDEYRENFMLTTIKSAIEKGIGYELELPGAHSDIGGGYAEIENEKRFLTTKITLSPFPPESLKKLRQEYINQGWYKNLEININTIKNEEDSIFYLHSLVGNRIIPHTYQYISYYIMKYFIHKYTKIVFNEDIIKELDITIPAELKNLYNILYNYAINNDSATRKKIILSHTDLWVRNKYIHISAQENIPFMGAHKENNKPKRKELEG